MKACWEWSHSAGKWKMPGVYREKGSTLTILKCKSNGFFSAVGGSKVFLQRPDLQSCAGWITGFYDVYKLWILDVFVRVPLKLCIRELFLVCVGGCLSSSAHPVCNALDEKLLGFFFSHPSTFHDKHTKDFSSKHPQDVDPSTHQAPGHSHSLCFQ